MWSPDGESIVFTATIEAEQGRLSVPSTSICTAYPREGRRAGGASPPGPTATRSPLFSPDGKTLYALHHRTESAALYSLARLVKIDWPDTAGRPKFLTPNWDRSVQDIAITPDGRRIYLTAEEYGHDKLFTVPAAAERRSR